MARRCKELHNIHQIKYPLSRYKPYKHTSTMGSHMIKIIPFPDFCGPRNVIWSWRFHVLFLDWTFHTHELGVPSAIGRFDSPAWIPCTKASNAENVSIWWRHHDFVSKYWYKCPFHNVQQKCYHFIFIGLYVSFYTSALQCIIWSWYLYIEANQNDGNFADFLYAQLSCKY